MAERVKMMFRIGIIGSDNSHALAFSKLANLKDDKTGDYLFPDVRVTGIFGLEKERTEEVADKGKIEFIAEKPEDLLGKVDAVMVVFRHGDLHAPYALPFIEKGIPTWIDKPFTIKISEAQKLIEAADRSNTLVTGGSTLKYTYDIQTLKNFAENNTSMGKLLGGVMNYPANLENEYGGLYFYGNHLAEMVMTVFGYDIKSVRASLHNGSITVCTKYDDFQVTLNYVDCWGKYTGVLYFEKGTIARDIDDSLGYRLGFEKLVEMLRSGKRPFPLEHLLIPTVFLNAVEKSIKTGNEVFLKELI